MRKVKEVTKQAISGTLADLVKHLNSMLQGWANYFRHAASSATFAMLGTTPGSEWDGGCDVNTHVVATVAATAVHPQRVAAGTGRDRTHEPRIDKDRPLPIPGRRDSQTLAAEGPSQSRDSSPMQIGIDLPAPTIGEFLVKLSEDNMRTAARTRSSAGACARCVHTDHSNP